MEDEWPKRNPLSSKILVSNRTALKRKYGTDGVAAMERPCGSS